MSDIELEPVSIVNGEFTVIERACSGLDQKRLKALGAREHSITS